MERRLVSCRREGIGSRLRLLLFILFTISNPGNTTINVFDYWIRNNSCQSLANGNTSGINKGHNFIFSRATSNQAYSWNRWTGYDGAVTQDIVEPLLGDDNFPILNVGNNHESLAYLFDLDERYVSGSNNQQCIVKKVYEDVGELFTVDGDGHYIFNSDNENAILVCDENDENCEFSVTEQTRTDDTGFFPVSGGIKPNTLYLADSLTPIVVIQGRPSPV